MTTPSTDNYTLGRGKLYFTPKGGAEMDLGNAPALTANVSIDWLEHFSSRSGLKTRDKRVPLQLTPTLSFTLDEPVANNLNLLFLGTNTAGTIAAFTNPTTEGQLRFVSDNPLGVQLELTAWEVSLSPDGDVGLISDSWMEIKFKADVLKSSDPAKSASPYMDIVVTDPAAAT